MYGAKGLAQLQLFAQSRFQLRTAFGSDDGMAHVQKNSQVQRLNLLWLPAMLYGLAE
ncbi:hypothetical protein D3C87_1922310 [compost metagenome]